MTERYTSDPFELDLVAQLRDFGEVAVRPFDAASIAERATSGGRRAKVGLARAWPSLAVDRRVLWVLTMAMLAITIAAVAVAVGSRPRTMPTRPLVERPATLPSPETTDKASTASPSPSNPASLAGPRQAGLGTLAYGIDGTIFFADPDGTNARVVETPPTRSAGTVRWSADGQHLAWQYSFADGSMAITIVDPDSRFESRIGPGPFVGEPLWAPTSDRIAVMESIEDQLVVSVYGLGGDRIRTFKLPAGFQLSGPGAGPVARPAVGNIAWAPDGRTLAISGCVCPVGRNGEPASAGDPGVRFDLWTLDVGSGRAAQVTDSPGSAETLVTWSPAGDRVLFVSRCIPDALCLAAIGLRSVAPDGSDETYLGDIGDTGNGSRAVWSPDRTHILVTQPTGASANDQNASTDGLELAILSVPDGGISQLTHLPGMDTPIRWSIDGSRIMFRHEPPSERVRASPDGPFPSGEIWSVDLDGTNLMQLAPGAESADWRPIVTATQPVP